MCDFVEKKHHPSLTLIFHCAIITLSMMISNSLTFSTSNRLVFTSNKSRNNGTNYARPIRSLNLEYLKKLDVVAPSKYTCPVEGCSWTNCISEEWTFKAHGCSSGKILCGNPQKCRHSTGNRYFCCKVIERDRTVHSSNSGNSIHDFVAASIPLNLKWNSWMKPNYKKIKHHLRQKDASRRRIKFHPNKIWIPKYPKFSSYMDFYNFV